jgi:hypothetical protein
MIIEIVPANSGRSVWSAVINHSRTSGRPPQTAEFDWCGDLQRYLAPESEVVQITHLQKLEQQP